MRVVAVNPGPMALWGLVVATGLAIGSIPFPIPRRRRARSQLRKRAKLTDFACVSLRRREMRTACRKIDPDRRGFVDQGTMATPAMGMPKEPQRHTVSIG
jgi:hypothetical protein